MRMLIIEISYLPQEDPFRLPRDDWTLLRLRPRALVVERQPLPGEDLNEVIMYQQADGIVSRILFEIWLAPVP